MNHRKTMKVSIVSQARMASSRLSGKVLKQVKGKSLLFYHVDRAKWSGFPVIVATTKNREDDMIREECEILGIPCFRGDQDDVLDRFYRCAQENGLDAVIRITSDCPLIDGNLIKLGYDLFLESGADYVSNILERRYPRGLDFEIFTFGALEQAHKNACELPEREHVTPYIWRNRPELFKLKKLSYNRDKSGYRITVDTKEDFKLIEKLIKDFEAEKKGYEQLIDILDKHTYLSEINKEVEQKHYGE